MKHATANTPKLTDVPRTVSIGENIDATVVGTTLTLEIDLTAKGHPSSTGKNTLIASTRGNVNIGDVTVGLNIYRKRNGR